MNKIDISGFEWGYIRDFVDDLTQLFGGRPRYDFGYGGVRVTVGGAYRQRTGMFYFDGYAEVKKPGSRDFETKKIAQNYDGKLFMDRRDFYKTMGMNYIPGTISFTVTKEGNLINSTVTGAIVGTVFANVGGAFVSSLIAYYYQKDPGDYYVVTTTAYVYDPQGGFYDTITTYEVYYKSPYYNDYSEEPIQIVTQYLRTNELYE